jgi:hypothetical protein
MPKCIACGEEYADEKQHLIHCHNLKQESVKWYHQSEADWLSSKLDQPSPLTEIAYYLGLVCLFLAGFIFGNILMFAYLIIIQ